MTAFDCITRITPHFIARITRHSYHSSLVTRITRLFITRITRHFITRITRITRHAPEAFFLIVNLLDKKPLF